MYLLCAALLFLFFPVPGHAAPQMLTVTGLLKHPLALSQEDLAKYQSASAAGSTG
jgi:hypothetical protein